MSTVTQRMTRRILRRSPEAAPPTVRRRRVRWVLAGGAALLVLVWLLPVLVAHSPLLNWIVGMAAADLKGQVRVGSASLGWFSPIVVENVEVRGEDQELLVQVPRAAGDRSLAKILWNTARLGRFRVEGPEVHVVLRPDGSNVEDALAAYLAPSDEPSAPVDIGVDIEGGTLSITDARSGRAWRIEGLRLALGMSSDPSQPLELECSGQTAAAPRAGSFTVALKLGGGAVPAAEAAPPQPDAADAGASHGDLTLRTEQFPLALVEGFLARVDPQTRVDGRLSTAVQCQWGGPGAEGQAIVRGSLTVDDFGLATPLLGTDQLRLAELRARCDASWHQDTLQLDQAVVQCDAGNVSAVGTLDLSNAATKDWLVALQHQSYEINGRIDLAKLARLLPKTLRIQEGTEITSGQVRVALASRPGPDGMTWLGRLDSSDLAAVNKGRQIVWQQPVQVSLAARETKQGPAVDTLKCESDFLRVEGSGTADDLAATAEFDLDQLAAQLTGFVDLGNVRMAGGGTARLTWKRRAGRDFEADATVQLTNFQLAIPDSKLQLRENLAARLTATGRTDFDKEYRLDTAVLAVQAGQDRLDARLLEPVADLRNDPAWPLDVQLEGELADWLPRIRPWLPLDDWNPGGTYVLAVQGTGSAKAIEVRRAQLSVTQLRLRGHGLNVLEPRLDLAAAGTWNNQSGRLELKQAMLTAANLGVQADNVVLTTSGESGMGLSGAVSFRGTLEQVQGWLDQGAGPPDWKMAGTFTGGGEIQKSGASSGGAIGATISNLEYSTSSGTRFVQPQVRLGAKGSYDSATGEIRLEGAQLSADGLACAGSGRVTSGPKQTDLVLSGNLDYDMEKLAVLLRPYLGTSLRVAGRGSQPWAWRGPLDLATAEGEAGLGWTSIGAYGFRGGPATLKANLARGAVQIQPIEMELNEGKLGLAGAVRVSPSPVELYVQKGSAARQVRITPEMCASALMFIAPVLADVAAAEGKFSIELDECRVPLADPAQGNLKGRFIVHSVQVGPGPLVRELAILLGREAPARLQRESVVPFQMAGGRIYHEGLELVFPDLTIRTHGSVGLDHTLLLMAEMPVPPKWTALNPRVATAMKDQVIRLPINGTLERPQIDRRTLDQYTRQFVEKAAENVIRDEIRGQLDRLFGPRQ